MAHQMPSAGLVSVGGSGSEIFCHQRISWAMKNDFHSLSPSVRLVVLVKNGTPAAPLVHFKRFTEIAKLQLKCGRMSILDIAI